MENLARIYAAFCTFRRSDCGAVTVDFVVLTGALVGLGALVMGNVAAGTMELSASVSTAVENALPSEELPIEPLD